MTRRSRSRERSPSKRVSDRRRSRSRDRDRRQRHRRSRSRSPKRYRSRSPVHKRSISPRRRSRSRSQEKSDDPEEATTSQPPVDIDESQLEGKTEEEIAMIKLMGFSGFDSTKNKQVNKGESYVANIQRKRRYRQYMNRKGGFNRPLDFIA